MHANNNGFVGAGPFTMPMPSWMAAAIGPYCQSGDGNMVIVDSVTGNVWECWHTTPPTYTPRDAGASSANWNCSEYRFWSADTLTRKGYNLSGYTASNPPGTSGSKINLSCGMLTPDDFADCWNGDPGTAIPHMMRMDTFCGSNGTNWAAFVSPATASDGRQNFGIPDGARVQLDPSLNIANWASINAKPEPWRSALKKICRGLQIYGITQVDAYGAPGNGSIDCPGDVSVSHGGDSYAVGYQWPWVAAGLSASFTHGVPYDLMSRFRVIDWNVWNVF
jgi:hypothetical protein